ETDVTDSFINCSRLKSARLPVSVLSAAGAGRLESAPRTTHAMRFARWINERTLPAGERRRRRIALVARWFRFIRFIVKESGKAAQPLFPGRPSARSNRRQGKLV